MVKKLIFNIKRQVKWFFQRRKRGFDDRELWDLDDSITKFILPRLKAFKEKPKGYPCSIPSYNHQIFIRLKGEDLKSYEEDLVREWNDILTKIINAFEMLHDDSWVYDKTDMKQKQKKIDEGLKLFIKHYYDLWY